MRDAVVRASKKGEATPRAAEAELAERKAALAKHACVRRPRPAPRGRCGPRTTAAGRPPRHGPSSLIAGHTDTHAEAEKRGAIDAHACDSRRRQWTWRIDIDHGGS